MEPQYTDYISLGTSSFCECSARHHNLSFALNSTLHCFLALALPLYNTSLLSPFPLRSLSD